MRPAGALRSRVSRLVASVIHDSCCEKLRFVTAGLLKASVELLELFAGRIDARPLPSSSRLATQWLGEIASRFDSDRGG